ncbi:hypothetical protein niasHT_036922 [Heterodera trifolii]|uniref:Aspartic peptidase DDI1-type domain-containing protein n=1 Tax=Heterodera trifolii TaxID=157864 RepID=A0ABD2ID21_9BILA
MAHLQYIRMKANDCPGVAFVRSGCDISFISESFAREANLLGNIDRSNRQTIYVPVFGGAKLLGWVNDVKIGIDELNLKFKCRLGVMEDKHLPMYCQEKFDILLGTDLLYAHKLKVDFGRGITRRGKIAKFLTEEEIRRIRSHRGRMARAIYAMMGIFVVVFIIIIISSDY